MHPAEKETPDRAESSTQICVLSAGFGHRGAEFGEGQRAKEGKQSAGNPRGVHYAAVAADRPHFSRLQKNSGPDHRPDDDGRRSPRTQAAYQLESFIRMRARCDNFLLDEK